MEYYHNVVLDVNFDEAVNKTKEALKSEGFGIITEIDMQAKLAEKLGVNFKKYTILGACNPEYSYQALQIEEKIGTMLPCNVVVIEKDKDTTEIAAIDPIASMLAINNQKLEILAKVINEKIRAAMNQLKFQEV